jgi:iron complex transport system ATP-binding protein
MILRADNLTLSVPGKVLCRNLSFAIRSGECWAVLGCNGSGKTTLLHALSGLSAPMAGRIELDARPLRDFPRRELAREIGVLLQDEAQGFWGTVLEYTRLGRFPHGDADESLAHDALQRTGMETFAERRLATLSGGERQRVRIAQLLAQAPHLYALDEPLQHLDLRHQAATMDLLRELARQEGRAVVMVLHEPWWATRYCSHALLLFEDGHALGGAADIILTPENLEKLYGYPPINPICV